MVYPEIPLAQSILQIFKAKGLQHIIISPGSRNAPLTIGFASDPFFTCYSIADERCAAFFALGIAQQRRLPVALVCTSGSALLNYYPAVAEAFYSQIPLIVLSADRPSHKIDIGDGQTIRQQNVYSNHSLFNANLTEEASSINDSFIQEAIQISIEKKGPVHINAPFEEPLYNTLNKQTYIPEIKQFKELKKNKIDFIYYQNKWQKSPKKLILIGSQNPGILSNATIEKWAKDPSVLVFTEITSNVYHPAFISNIDTLITSFSESEFSELQPDVLITIGGMIVSKRVKAFLRKYRPGTHWHIDPLRAYDTFQALTHHIVTEPELFFAHMSSVSTTESTYQSTAIHSMQKKRIGHQRYMAEIPFSDLKVFELIWNVLPENIQLQISNSAVIRYTLLFPPQKNTEVFCNRGTSGIDGSTSTAVGAATTTSKPTVLITGDISFFYDSNALWNNYIPKNFKIILINNGGGGIFRILPGHQENKVFNTYFETEHQLTAEYLARMFSFRYISATDVYSTQKGLDDLFNDHTQPVILEIFTPTKNNQDILKNYFEAVDTLE